MRTPLCIAVALMGAQALLYGGPKPAQGIFELYRQNRVLDQPNYVTEDLLLLSYSMIFRDAVAEHEQSKDYSGLKTAVQRLYSRAAKAGDSEAARANRDFLLVLLELLGDPERPEHQHADAAVADELGKIRAAAGPSRSALMLQTIDYSQMRPRGHYTKSPELSRYFTAVHYAGSVLFYVKESAATGIDEAAADRLTHQAVLLAHWIQGDPVLSKWFSGYEARVGWLFGPSEDLRRQDLIAAQTRKRLLARAKTEGRQPTILSAAVNVGSLEKDVTPADALTGWRLLPGSFSPDSAAGQQLVYGNVGKYLGTGKPVSMTSVNGMAVKGFPLANELMAMLGSAEATAKLKTADETNFEGYQRAEQAARKQLARPAGLASQQLNLLRDWFAQRDGDPAIKLASARGFWTWTRHESVLYAKQSYTGVGKGIEPPDSRSAAWLEPSETLYLGLRKIAAELSIRLDSKRFGEYARILDRCIGIAKIERAGRALSAADVSFLNGIDRDLSALVAGPDAPIAVDVHTDVNSGEVLIEALGYPRTVTHENMRGARFNPQEFRHPLSDRLTDEKWLEMLRKKEN